MELLEDLKYRGLIKDITDEKVLEEVIKNKSPLYCGFDPTGPSLHIGHLVPILILKRFHDAGFKVFAVIGGGTGLIGDPSGRSSERQLLTLETSLENANSIKNQLSRFLDFENGKAIMVNNYDWISKINMIEFLRDYGKNFQVNYMLAKDTVARRLETGISYTEFSYMIIQSIDFLTLYKNYGVKLQIGGSDQWGNLTSGVELIRKSTGNSDCVGVTVPLITKSDGTKFGKSASGASFWLDKEKTSPYELYQYFLNTNDSDVIHYLKVFTFLSKEEIESYNYGVINEPHLRAAQKRLAFELVKLIHGEDEANNAVKMSEVLFGGDISKLSYEQLLICLKGVESVSVEENTNIVDALVLVKAASSKREARELLAKQTYSLNGEKINSSEILLTKENAIGNKIYVVRRGKKNYFLIKIL